MSQQTAGHVRGDIKRSESLLTRLQGATGLTEAGKEWLIAAFDPFHDRDVNCTGFPDALGSNSVVQLVTGTLQVNAPGGSNWDCHVIEWPFLGPITNVKDTFIKYNTLGDSTGAPVKAVFSDSGESNGLAYGGLCAYTFNTTANNVSPFTGSIQSRQQYTLPNGYLQSPYRVIAQGFEVYNTTPELYKGGSVCVYKQPLGNFVEASTVGIVGSGSNVMGYVGALVMEAPPANAAEALLLPTSRQWDAREGCYVIPTLQTLDIGRVIGNYTQPFYYNDTPGDSTYHGPSFSYFPTTGQFPVFVNQNFTHFDQVGAIFTGLSPQTTLTLNYRAYIEVFPSSGSLLSTLAKPSPSYDPVAVDIYANIMKSAPIGVEVKFNGLGDWFIDGINAVKDMVAPIAAPILKQMKHPAAQAIGALLTGKKKNENGLGKIGGKAVQGPMTKEQHDKNMSKKKKKK
jgi:hypothetical protein